MAPKRSVKIAAPVKKVQSLPEKVARGRPKKEKQSKVPNVITISVPVTENSSGVLGPDQKTKVDIKIPMPIEDAKSQLLKSPVRKKVQNNTAALRRGRSKVETVSKLSIESDAATAVKGVLDTERKVDLKTKVALANEVARSQLLKEPIEARVNTAPPAPKKGSRRNKQQIISEFCNKRNVATALKVTGKKPLLPSKKITKKSIQTPDMKTGVTKKRKAVSTEEKPTAKRRNETKAINKEQTELKVDLSVDNKTTKDNLNKCTENNTLFNSPMVVIPVRRRRLWRGKKNNDISKTKTTTLPHLFNELAKSQKESEITYCKSPILQASSSMKPIQSNDKAKDATQQNSHQTSTSSISDLSWTHDISSSSTTTCLTVSSKSFVCFNNKMPVVKLRNIQNEVNKLQPSREGKTLVNEEISSFDNETSCDKPISLIDSDSLIKNDALNLSSSSITSIKKQINDDKPKLNKKDYTQAAKNLEHALEKIDMEFINWIPESEYVSTDFNKLKDKLFHILKSEFRALTHCKLLQEISTNSKSDDNYVDMSYNKNKSEITTERVNQSNVIVGNNGINNNIPHDTNITIKDIENESLQQNSVKIRDKSIIQTSELNKNNTKNRIESDGEVTKSRTIKRISDELSKRDSLSLSEDSSSESGNSSVHSEVKSPHNPHDDDDALSLFAESITGIESSKLNTSTASIPKQIEEYIPEPIQGKPNYTYCPTKIADVKTNTTKTICQKQNADSTSISREANNNSPLCNASVSNSDNYQQTVMGNSSKNSEGDNMFSKDEDTIVHEHKDATSIPLNADKGIDNKSIPEERILKKPFLIADIYKLRPKAKQIIFQGICYFNIIQKCMNTENNKMCLFSHRIPDEKEITDILFLLNNALVIKEYILSRRYEKLLNRYGICFAKVCVERRLTRLLVEMALDFSNGSFIDESLKVTIVEMTLMHLNNVDLCECEDLLMIKLHSGKLLCDVFMQIMTSSQNFSRFKQVFMNLTYFMVNNDRTFSLEVAEQILERVCILAFDESLVRALLQVMRLTSREIFLNSMIVQFEKQISVNSDILAEYATLKKEINFGNTGRWVENRPFLSTAPISPKHSVVQQLYQPMTRPILMATEEQKLSDLREGVPLPPSPDTTHLEILNKTSGDTIIPKITRTISGLNSSQYKPSVVFSPAASNSEEVTPTPKYQNWRNKSIMHRIAGSPRRLMRPPLRLRTSMHRKSNRWHDHRFVTLGGSPTSYPPPDANY